MFKHSKTHSLKLRIVFTLIVFFSLFLLSGSVWIWAGGTSWTPDQDRQSQTASGAESVTQSAQPKLAKPDKTQRELIRKIDDLYREIVAATRANRLTHALDKIELAEALLDADMLPEDYCQRFRLKIERVKKDMRNRYLRDVQSGRRQKEERMLEHLMISSLPEMSQIPLPSLSQVARSDSPQPRADESPAIQPQIVPVTSAPETSRPVSEPEPEQYEIIKPDIPADPALPSEEAVSEVAAVSESNLSDPKNNYYYLLDEKLDMLYEDGLAFYRQGLYDQARHILNSVNKASPGYKLTAEYLRLITRQTDQDQAGRKERIDPFPATKDDDRSAVINHYMDIYE